jgi:ubiquinone/menaquinone biosynthesis C-methylase UbiE
MKEEIRSQRDYWNQEANSFQKIYSHQKSAIANWMDRVFRKDMYDRFTFTIQNCEPISGRTFLDIGCGSGLYSIELAKKGASSVVGIDIAENMLNLCRESAEREAVANRCTFLQADLLQYSSGSSFDVCFGVGLFDYIHDPLPVLKKMRQVAREKVILSFPRLWTWRAPLRKIRLTLRGCDVYFYTRNKVTYVLREAGFGKIEIFQLGKLYCVVASVQK